MGKRVLFIHYRIGERDGVSLEIEKRAKVLRNLGAEVSFLSGFDGYHRKESYEIPLINIRHKEVEHLRSVLFEPKVGQEDYALKEYYRQENILIKEFYKAFEVLKPSIVYAHNILSHGYNLPATTALFKVLDQYQIPTVGIHHDFWFEREKFSKPQFVFVENILRTMPPQRPYIIKHQVINSLAAEELSRRRNIIAEQIGDYFDYDQKKPKKDAYTSTFEKDLGLRKDDLVVLQATRITERKAIENAMYFVRYLEDYIRSKTSITLNGKTLTKKSRVVLFFPNFVEVGQEDYFKRLQKLADKLGIIVIWPHMQMAAERSIKNNKKYYSFWDSYLFADLITYPSVWEGFGNQFLEAIFFEKLPVVFEYPVFEKDIKKEGYTFISLGNKIKKKNGYALVPSSAIKKAVYDAIAYLSDIHKLAKLTAKNYKIAKSNHNESLLIKDIKSTYTYV